jgi:hypothetical protein
MTVNPNLIIGLSASLFIVWMQRNGRWALMIHTMDNKYKIAPLKGAAA